MTGPGWTMLLCLAGAAGIPGAALAETWVKQDAAGIHAALDGAVLAYGDGTSQAFHADGTTLTTGDHASTGAWRVTGDQYCSQWPPSDSWACYDLELNGTVVRFTAASGATSDGQVVTP